MMKTGAQPPVPVTSRSAALLNQQSICQVMAIISDTVCQQQKWYSKEKNAYGHKYSHDTYLIDVCYWQWLVRLAYERGGFPGRVFILWSQKCSYRQRVAAFKGWCGVLYVLCDSHMSIDCSNRYVWHVRQFHMMFVWHVAAWWCQEAHRFDLHALRLEMKLSFYQQVKLINYIRRQVRSDTC